MSSVGDRSGHFRVTRREMLAYGALGLGGVAAAATLLPGLIHDGELTSGPSRDQHGALVIPPLLEGRRSASGAEYDLELASGLSRFVEAGSTPTIGINGAYLGPTLVMRSGDTVQMNVTNRLSESATLHWHGFHLPVHADGGPHQAIAPGATWRPRFEVRQRAGLFWYHSHAHRRAGPQVYHGLAGLIYVRDSDGERTDLPHDYGVDDIPVIVQDRAFAGDGHFAYSTSMMTVMMGATGDTLLVNGGRGRRFETKSDRVRIRLLNASNARFYRFALDDARPFEVIGSDGGLLPNPLQLTSLVLAPAERAEMILDFSDGRPRRLIAHPASGMRRGMMMGGGMMRGGMMGNGRSKPPLAFDVVDFRPAATRRKFAPPPKRLIPLPPADPSRAVRERRFVLAMGGMMSGGFTINGRSMDMQRIDETVPVGEDELWVVENASMMAHPFHVHDGQFRIIDRNGQPPPEQERGLKDVVVVPGGGSARILVRFDDYADSNAPYMYHCHILEHEDAGMMGQFVVA